MKNGDKEYIEDSVPCSLHPDGGVCPSNAKLLQLCRINCWLHINHHSFGSYYTIPE
jgi:hypothetical protein